METVSKIKLHINTSHAFPPYLFAYSYRLFEKFNRAPLALFGLGRGRGGGKLAPPKGFC